MENFEENSAKLIGITPEETSDLLIPEKIKGDKPKGVLLTACPRADEMCITAGTK